MGKHKEMLISIVLLVASLFSYTVVAQQSNGNYQIQSGQRTLNSRNNIPGEGPYFIEEPNDADVIPGGSLVFSCKAKLQDQILEDVSWTKVLSTIRNFPVHFAQFSFIIFLWR